MTETGPFNAAVARRRRSRRFTTLVLVLAAIYTLTACQTSTEALAAAQQLTHTSQQLSDYYANLVGQVDETVTLNQIQSEMFSLPFDDSDYQRFNTTRLELGKRAATARALSNLASAYAALAGSKAGTDISIAASDLAQQCGAINKLPGGPAIPDVVGQAAAQLVELIRARKLRQSSVAVSQTVAAIDALFEKEMPVYESINRQRVTLAQSLAVQLVNKDLVDVNPLLMPALKPFELAPVLPPNHTAPEFRSLAAVEIKTRGDNQIHDFAAISEAMATALKSTQQQVEFVAKKHGHLGGLI